MSTVASDVPPPVNHVFVDFENVHEVDLAIIGGKTVSFTLLMGPRQTKLDASLVEKLFAHAASVQLVRLASTGRNALDFILTYYVGRAVAFDPTGAFHIVSRDKGFEPLIEHLRSKRVTASRHDSFATLPFATAAKVPDPPPPIAVPKLKSPSKPKLSRSELGEQEVQVLEHWRKSSATRPRRQEKLVSFLVAHFGHRMTRAQALDLIQHLSQAGHLTIGEKAAVTYHLANR